MSNPVYKVVGRDDWRAAQAEGKFRGAEIDIADGYIHLSAGDQVVETVDRHFRGQKDLLLIAFERVDLGDALKWEPSRGGALFPHYYGELDTRLATREQALEDMADGSHRFPENWK